ADRCDDFVRSELGSRGKGHGALTLSLPRLLDPQSRVDLRVLDDRAAARWPEDLDAIHRRRTSEAEVLRQRALREVAGLPVVIARLDAAVRRDADRPTQAVAVGRGPDEDDLEPVDRLLLREVADENLRRGVELVGHDVEVSVAVDVED